MPLTGFADADCGVRGTLSLGATHADLMCALKLTKDAMERSVARRKYLFFGFRSVVAFECFVMFVVLVMVVAMCLVVCATLCTCCVWRRARV